MCRKSVSLSVVVGFLVFACSQERQESIRDYLPMNQGTVWHYEIEIGHASPHISRTLHWVDSEGNVTVVNTSGLYFRSMEGKVGKKYQLILRVIGKAPEKTPLDYREGVELRIEKDELRVYDEGSTLLWLIPDNPRFIVDETVLLPAESRAAPPSWSGRTKAGFGYYYQPLLFEGRAGSMIKHGEQSPPELHFVTEKGDYLVFARINGLNPSGEALWFEKGKGLIRLRQTVGETMTMTWDLVDFVPGE